MVAFEQLEKQSNEGLIRCCSQYSEEQGGNEERTSENGGSSLSWYRSEAMELAVYSIVKHSPGHTVRVKWKR